MRPKNSTVEFQVGVNIVGLPHYVAHDVPEDILQKNHPKHQNKTKGKTISKYF